MHLQGEMPGRFPKSFVVACALVLCALVAATLIAATSMLELAERATGALAGVGSNAPTPRAPRSLAARPPPAKELAAAPTPTDSVSFVATQDPANTRPPADAVVPRCPERLRLVGSVVDVEDPKRSLAAIRMNGGTRLTPVHATVADLVLMEIGPSSAYFRRPDGSACQLPVFLPRAERVNAPAPAAVATSARANALKRAAAEMAALNAGISQIGPDTFAVSRDAMTKALGSLTTLRRSGRFRVRQESGRTVGMELVRMRGDSPLQRLGLQSGDVVRKLNGHDIAAPDGALQALQAVKSQDRFSLAVVRSGTPRTLSYEVR